MELYLDTANIATVKRLADILPLNGVTTNPSILAKEGRPFHDVLVELDDIFAGKGQLFAQVMANDVDGMVADAKRLRECVPHIIVKIPVIPQGLQAIKRLTQEGIPTLGTAVYSAGQGLLGALAGARYIAPYVNRVDAQGGDGIQVVSELQQLLAMHAPHANVMAASFKTPRQAVDCLLNGCQAITLPADIAEQLISLPAVDAAVQKFEQDWHSAFHRVTL